MEKFTIDGLAVKGKKIFVRVDFNVPINDNGEITDATRIDSSIATITSLVNRGARVALISHLGRPNGIDLKYSLAPVASYLSGKLGTKVAFCPQIIGDIAKKALGAMSDGDVLLFENIRFYPEEEKNDAEFCNKIAQNFDLYANDAFGTAHRAHASTYGVAKFFTNPAAGYLMIKEITALDQILEYPQRPFISVLGGAKIKDKIKVIAKLLQITNGLLIGGAMAYTFLKVKRIAVGRSLVDNDSLKLAEIILNSAQKNKKAILLPQDHIVSDSMDGQPSLVSTIPDNKMALDIGPKTIELYSKAIVSAAEVFWNGPMGVFENEKFNKGTFAIAKALNSCKGHTVVGGGDSVAAIYQSGYSQNISHISTGGGASLEYLEGTKLPGIEILSNK